MKHRNKILPAALCGLLTLLCVFALFRVLYLYDNKYTAGPPYGSDGVFSFTEADLGRPLFLVDGWLLSVDGAPEQETFIGRYSNFSYVTGGSPFGKATYRLTLQCPGTHALALEIPEVFTDYTLYLDGSPIAQNGSGTSVGFVLKDYAELLLVAENYSHYYSGLYYPPALGTTETVGGLLSIRLALYAALAACTLTLAIFSAVLWVTRARDSLFLHFGLLSLGFFLSCLHPFLWQLGWSSPLGYALEDAGRLFMLFQAVEVGAILAQWPHSSVYRRLVRPLGWGTCALCFCFVLFIIPTFGGSIKLFGLLADLVYLSCWAVLCFCAANRLRHGHVGSVLLTSGCCALGAGLLINLLNNNRFEPIYAFWQNEWTGLLLVCFFAVLMVRHNRDILLKNKQLVAHMEELVQERTRELNTVLEERKRFFDHMAHNLKAPITAVHGFIGLIRESNLYLDDELREYIRLIEEENDEVRRRVQSLSALHAYDAVTAPREALNVDELLAQVYAQNAPEASAAGIHFTVNRLGQSASILAQREKLFTLFENLIYNALAFTPSDGSITITPSLHEAHVIIDVSDTGCGIAEEHLPHIFEQFYSARPSKNEGSGLGLYIVKLSAEELGGTATVISSSDAGTTFRLCLPINK